MPFEEIAGAFTCKKLPESEFECQGEIPEQALHSYKEKALAELALEVEMPGFRKGNVPKELVLKKVGEVAVMEEALEIFLRDFYPVLAENKKLDVVGRPDIRVTKLAPGNPVELRITSAVYPEITLPKNWKAFGEKVPATKAEEVKEEEVTETIESLRKSRASKDAEGKEVLPEADDEFAKTLGAFKDLEDLKAQIRKGIGEEKEKRAKDTRRGKIVDILLEKTEMDIPRVFVESELEKIVAQLRDDCERMGTTLEDYLKHTGKTETELRDGFKEQASRRAKLQLTLNTMAAEEKVEADEAAVEEEMKHALEHFPDARPDLLRVHVQTILRNEKILQMLEEQK